MCVLVGNVSVAKAIADESFTVIPQILVPPTLDRNLTLKGQRWSDEGGSYFFKSKYSGGEDLNWWLDPVEFAKM